MALTSCQEILFRDDEEEREISLDSFKFVELSGIYNLELVQDSMNKLVISGKNNIQFIEGIVKNDTLQIKDNKKISVKPGRNKLYLHFSNLEYLTTNDPVNISSRDTLRSDIFYWDALGEIVEANLLIDCNYLCMCTSANTLGMFRFSGNAENCDFFIRYGSIVHSENLICKNVIVTSETVGDITVNASENLSAYIRSNGNIYYRGNPQTAVAEQKGSGQLLRLNN
ncbi:MAG TPA: DUF2807 domain-containing protein [Bacteroidales bacterium]|nr:DUF2807 domain-containing protein [Bacteroidales bacterium]